jgi:hypothetical protein
MLNAGLTQAAIAGAMGISRSYVSAILTDPDGLKERARKVRYAGTCEKCGGKTDGSNGPGKAPRICMSCIQGLAPGETRPAARLRGRRGVAGPPVPSWIRAGLPWPQPRWNREKVIDAYVEVALELGRLPMCADFSPALIAGRDVPLGERGRPCTATVYRYLGQPGRDTWPSMRNAAIAAAHRLPVEMVLNTRANAWWRRRVIEELGAEKLLPEIGKLVQQDDYGKLWRLEIVIEDGWHEDGHRYREPDPFVVMVEVVNSTPNPDGSHDVYYLRVPPETKTAREGIAWTFGTAAEDYELEVQT